MKLLLELTMAERDRDLRKYGITEPIFQIGDRLPSSIGWLSQCRHELPNKPGFVYLGIANEIQFSKLADTSIRDLVNGLPDDPNYHKGVGGVSSEITAGLNRDSPWLWIAWEPITYVD